MPLPAIPIENLPPASPGAKPIMIDRTVFKEPETERDKYYHAACETLISGPGWFLPEHQAGIPNPYGLVHWDGARWPEGPYETTTMSFEEITNLRTQQLAKQFEQDDLPIVVSYSGGIDSAVIVAAMVKYFSRDMLDRVILKMNNLSYFESPTFFDQVIQKCGIKYTDELIYDWENAHIIAGEPGDSIWITSTLIEMSLRYENPHKMDAIRDPDALIEWLTFLTDEKTARWYYEIIRFNAHKAGFTVETYEDFFWWAKTNFAYGAGVMHMITHIANPWHEGSWENYKRRAIPWYHTSEYRLYSSTNRNNDVKYNGTISSYKMPAKKYINDLLCDPYYLKYKVKVNSIYNKESAIAALYDDGTLVLKSLFNWKPHNI